MDKKNLNRNDWNVWDMDNDANPDEEIQKVPQLNKTEVIVQQKQKK